MVRIPSYEYEIDLHLKILADGGWTPSWFSASDVDMPIDGNASDTIRDYGMGWMTFRNQVNKTRDVYFVLGNEVGVLAADYTCKSIDDGFNEEFSSLISKASEQASTLENEFNEMMELKQ